ncbi:MAG: FAD-binding oxidoreductase [Acidobacteria bacterium]|nr:FAD-binding oxidoreductase [Acidobacteriota bacterium]
MTHNSNSLRWGPTPWTIDVSPRKVSLPAHVDIAVVGGGFSGLSAAANLKRFDPTKSVAIFEADKLGARSSGHTGGLALAETAAGDLPGLGDVLGGVSAIVADLGISCDLELPGVYELDRATENPRSPICWTDTGSLRVGKEVAGGTLDPGKMVAGLARAAAERDVLIVEHARIDRVEFTEPLALHIGSERVDADRVIFATNSESLELTQLAKRAQPKLTMALATGPLSDERLVQLGMASGKPCYTTDLPYLWGRLVHKNRVIFGSGLVDVADWRELTAIDVNSGRALKLLDKLENRVRRLHPALLDAQITHRWGGPILITEDWRPVFEQHPKSANAIVMGGYSGHGVALSVYLGAWAAEALLGRRPLPKWKQS